MRNCLVLDDSPLVRKVARFLVEELDFAVMEAGTPAEALECCRKTMPHVILLDADLPENGANSFMTSLTMHRHYHHHVAHMSAEACN